MTPDQPSTRPCGDGSSAERSRPPHYDIRVSGRLGSRWAAWFDGLTLSAEDDGVTLISGPIVDEAALHGLLAKLRDLGMPLVSLAQRPPHAATAPSTCGFGSPLPNQPGAT